MSIIKIIFIIIFTLTVTACKTYKVDKIEHTREKIFYTSNGFALIYDYDLYEQGLIDKKFSVSRKTDNKINNEKILVMHSFLKINTPIRIINPENLKVVETKIFKKANYPKIFNLVISKKTAESLELDFINPYIEVVEVKKNKTFIAKESNIFEEEKNVVESAPIDEVLINDLSKENPSLTKKIIKKNKFILVISDFYYLNSANNLKIELFEKMKTDNFYVKKIKKNIYRLYAGPFQNFNALKSTYISLNNLGFEDLNIYKE